MGMKQHKLIWYLFLCVCVCVQHGTEEVTSEEEEEEEMGEVEFSSFFTPIPS